MVLLLLLRLLYRVQSDISYSAKPPSCHSDILRNQNKNENDNEIVSWMRSNQLQLNPLKTCSACLFQASTIFRPRQCTSAPPADGRLRRHFCPFCAAAGVKYIAN